MKKDAIESWSGEMSEVGAIYPFQGTEILLVILGVLFWLGWHVFVLRREAREYEEYPSEHDVE